MIMNSETITSIIEFSSMLSGGFFIALLFDVFRSMRKAIRSNKCRTPDVVVLLQDILFLLATFVLSVLLIYRVSNGRLPWYISLGCFIGAFLYFFIVEKLTGKILFAFFYIVIKVVKTAFEISCKVYRKVKYIVSAKNIKKSVKKVPEKVKNS